MRQLFIKPPIKNKRINPSWQDIKRNVRVPTKIDKNLAEECGIHIGDGNLHVEKSNKGGFNFRYRTDGNLLDEYIYHNDFIRPLMDKLYGFTGFLLTDNKKNSIASIFKSKAIVEYKSKILKFPIGSKFKISIPTKILSNQKLMERCMVGIIDTDFNINKNMMINGALKSPIIIKQMCNCFDEHRFKYTLRRVYMLIVVKLH